MTFNGLLSSVEGGELFERVVDESYILTVSLMLRWLLIRKSFKEMAVASIVYQLCEAIRYIHSQKIIHLDLKVTVVPRLS